MFEFVETKRHTVESVYEQPETTVLAQIDGMGYQAFNFRIPVAGDWYMPTGGCVREPFEAISWLPKSGPRLILRRKTVKRRVLTETGEVRQAHSGEMYDYYGVVMRASITTGETYPIYRETFDEVEL